MRISLSVHGTPQPQGSAKAFIPKGWKRAIITSDNAKMKPWRQQISGMAAEAMQGQELAAGPVRIEVDFYFAKPKSAKKSLEHKITKPDIDKLARSVLDALSGIAFRDDSQVVELTFSKNFGLPERVSIQAESIV
jgi:crossover junction endodeoxyribonuclease RusA